MKPLDHYWNSINPVSLLLLPLAGLFCSLSWLRRKLYRLGVLASWKSPLPVIIVGNITVGGSGKTPLIIELVRQLQRRGRKPAVISRGYGGHGKTWPQLVGPDAVARQVGDEPVLIFQRTACPVVVGPNRKQDIQRIIEGFDCDIILCDDGMQHYALQRDIEIAVVDARRRFGNGFCLPAGPLREMVSRLRQVDLVLLNGGDMQQSAFQMRIETCRPLSPRLETRPLAEFVGKKVHAVAGIGDPQRFFDMLAEQGLELIPHAFADHYPYTRNELIFDDECPVLMTEKDAVKCADFNLENHWAVALDIRLSSNAQNQLDMIFDTLSDKPR